MSADIESEENAVSSDNVYVGVYDLSNIEDEYPEWDDLTGKEKLQILREEREPEQEIRSENTTCIGLDEARVLQLDATREVDDPPVEVALGDDDSAPPEYDNRSLNNELGRTAIDEYDPDGTSIIINAFLPRRDLNDDGTGSNPDLVEGGLVSENEKLLNHSLFTAVTKTAQRGLQIQITINFDTA